MNLYQTTNAYVELKTLMSAVESLSVTVRVDGSVAVLLNQLDGSLINKSYQVTETVATCDFVIILLTSV